MGKKRKSSASSLDDVDRTMYASFSTAANSLSQLYTQAMNHQKHSFQAGERHALENLYHWICRDQGVSTFDILNYLQHEMELRGDDQTMSPRVPPQNQQATAISLGSSLPTSAAGHGVRPEQYDPQPKNSFFSNALSSPVRRSLQPYQIAQGGGCSPSSALNSGTGSRNNEPNFLQQQIRESNPPSSNDSSMDMHSDSPVHYPHF